MSKAEPRSQSKSTATFGLLVGGGPAPGINGVISSATLAARKNGSRVIGLLQGFEWLMQGDIEHVVELDADSVSRIHEQGGSILRTSRANPTRDPAHLARVVESLHKLGIDHLISIGGDDTCFSAKTVAEAAGDALCVAHVPKTIDNDLPLPEGVPTFGFETARATAAQILTTLFEDARTSKRWFIVTLMGRNAGHLALGAAHSAGSTLAIVAEEIAKEVGDEKIGLDRLAKMVEGAMLKSTALGHPHGVIVLAEGLGECLDPRELPDLPLDEHGHLRLAELPLGHLIRERVREGLDAHGISATIIVKDIGYELRCVAPNAFDQDYTRDLGAGAVATLLSGTSDVMITRQNQGIVALPFSEILDPATGKTRIRMLDIETQSYANSKALQTRLESGDLEDVGMREALVAASNLDLDALRKRFA
ncbi:MAG: 6-phosphofructokinase [Myxococcales bacterium]|nr:6-phosphofructokinase [Myxococcales bacterium]HIL81067.1 6-phosphofructokinase [Myxococcales bacterium]